MSDNSTSTGNLNTTQRTRRSPLGRRASDQQKWWRDPRFLLQILAVMGSTFLGTLAIRDKVRDEMRDTTATVKRIDGQVNRLIDSDNERKMQNSEIKQEQAFQNKRVDEVKTKLDEMQARYDQLNGRLSRVEARR